MSKARHRKQRIPFDLTLEIRYLRYRLAIWILERKRRGGLL